jgi:SAM-dependent methyltransferase
MSDVPAGNADQIAYWNNTMGPAWVSLNDRLDAQLRALGLAAIETLGPTPGERLMDVGCGCGDTALELARRVGPGGSVIGVDVSRPMLELARQRAAREGLAQASFLEADAQTARLPKVDAAFSRFGVMFFADPTAAFANIRAGLPRHGWLAFVCWRSLAENLWMAVPAAAAASVAPAQPPAAPEAPGPFAFADRGRIERILSGAGFADVLVRPHDALLGWGDLEASVEMSLRMGPASFLVREYPGLRTAIEAAVRAALSPYSSGANVRMKAACWIVTGRAP